MNREIVEARGGWREIVDQEIENVTSIISPVICGVIKNKIPGLDNKSHVQTPPRDEVLRRAESP
jgi:hypothetical protein